MKHLLAAILFTILIGLNLVAQEPPRKNPVIERIISEISPLNINSNVQKLVSFGTRHTLSDTISNQHGIGAARRWIRSEFERYALTSEGRMSVELQDFMTPASARVPHPTRIVNVVAKLQAPRKSPDQSSERIFIISGHYDSRASNALDSVNDAPGANDDGSGTAVVMEIARVLSAYRFDATILFIAFAGEEQGLFGSTHCAEIAKQQGWTIEGVLNNDIVGNIHGGDGQTESTYVRLFSEAYSSADTGVTLRHRNPPGYENDGPSRTLARYVKELSDLYVPNFSVKLIYRRDRFLRGGDQIPFLERGFAAVRFTEAHENFDRQHQDVRTENDRSFGDLPDYFNPEYCSNIARVNAAALTSLALAPAPPSEVKILTNNLAYDTELRWKKNSELDVAGYVVRYRETSSPAWQASAFTSDTTFTVKVSKDDYLFGVQAIDKDGNTSLIAIPMPNR